MNVQSEYEHLLCGRQSLDPSDMEMRSAKCWLQFCTTSRPRQVTTLARAPEADHNSDDLIVIWV